MKHLHFLFSIILIMPLICNAENQVSVPNGFINGNTFRAFETTDKNIYITGLIDGILIASLYGAPKENLKKFESCTIGMTGQQAVAIVEKYLNENPEQWNISMNVIAFLAFKKACG